MALTDGISIRLEQGTKEKLHTIAEFYNLDDSELARIIIMSFIVSWIDNQMNGGKDENSNEH